MQFQIITWFLIACALAGCGPTYKAVEVTQTQPQQRQPASTSPEAPVDESAGPKPVPLEGYKPIEWRTLRGLEVKTGKSSPDLAAYTGANIRIKGFMVPFDDEDEQVTEFLLARISHK